MLQVSEDDIDAALKKRGIHVLQKKSVVLYGCTAYAAKICSRLINFDIAVTAIVDNDEEKQGTRCFEISVYDPKTYLMPYDENKIIVVCSMHEKEMLESLNKLGYGSENILHIGVGISDELDFLLQRIDCIKEGLEIYRSLTKEYGCNSTVIIMPHASGDAFIACSFLKIWCERNSINEYVVVGAGANAIDIAHLYCLNPIKRISSQDRESLIAAYMFYGQQLNVKLLSPWEMRISNSFFGMEDFQVSFMDKFRCEVFGMGQEAIPEEPRFSTYCNLDQYNLDCEKTLVIAPYAYSSPSPLIHPEVWERLANAFLDRGYRVYTVAYGKNEFPIRNTRLLRFSYYDAMCILKRAEKFIGVRSGLCDIIHAAECEKLIIYRGNRNSRAAQNLITFFGLKNLFHDFHGEEIMYGDFTEQEFIEFVIYFFEREKEK